MEKKTRVKIPKENKVRAELQKEISSKCPFCNCTDVGHFQIHHIDENPSNNQMLNLILVCPTCHSKITKGDYSPMEVLQKKITLLQAVGNPTQSLSNLMTFNGKVLNSIIGNNNKVTIKQTSRSIKKIIQKYPKGCIGFDNNRANYIAYLIDRYNKFKEYELNEEKINYAIFSSNLKKKYKIGPTRSLYNLSIEKFEELVAYIQLKIEGTKLAKMKGKSHKNYSTFKEYIDEKQR